MLRPSTARGMPALGMAARGSVVAPRMASIAVSTVAGPVEQLTPMAPAPHSVSSAAACCGEEPSRQLLSSSTVTMTSTGRSGAVSSAASSASRASFSAGMVSMISRSTPASARARICSAKAARASSRPVLPSGSRRTPSGPTEPATHAVAGLLLLEVLDGLPRQPDAGGIDLGHLGGQAVPREPEAVGAEGVGFKDLGAGLQILLVDGENQVGVGQVQFVVAAVDEDAARIEHRAHGAVGEHGAVGKDVGKLRPFCCHAIAWPAGLYPIVQRNGRCC